MRKRNEKTDGSSVRLRCTEGPDWRGHSVGALIKVRIIYHLRNRKRPTQHSIWKNGQRNHQNEETNRPMFRAASNNFNNCLFSFRNELEKSF